MRSVSQFLNSRESWPLIDVRSPKEFKAGHIPKAINVPLLSDKQREEIGITYKQYGREQAIISGFKLIGPEIENIIKEIKGPKVLVYCFRGGLRSECFNFLLKLFSIEGVVLQGGYKTYRQYIRKSFEQKANLIVLGGMTGSGKTYLLQQMNKQGIQTLDLEKEASHKGSAFGHLGESEQPTNEQFENNLFEIWKDLDLKRSIWVENESANIGRVSIVPPLYDQMKKAILVNLKSSKENRIKRLISDYAHFPPSLLKEAALKIERKLGGINLKLVLNYIDQKNFKEALNILLTYYDKTYQKNLEVPDRKRHKYNCADRGAPRY